MATTNFPSIYFDFNPRTNYDATTDPTVNDDISLGYTPGSKWINVSGGSFWVCVDSTEGAANWFPDMSFGTVTASCITTDKVDFNPLVVAPSFLEGRVYYDSIRSALSVQTTPEITLDVGQEQLVAVINQTGSTFNRGQVIFVGGESGGLITAELAIADATQRALEAMAVVTETILDGTSGFCTTFGRIRDLDTSSFTVGDSVFLSGTTAGELTDVRPISPDFTIRIGYIIISDVSLGQLHVTIDIEPPITCIADGMATEALSLTLVESGGTIFAEVETEAATGNASFVLEQDFWVLDTTTGSGTGGKARVALTAGASSSSPQVNYIFAEKTGTPFDAQLSASTSLPTGVFSFIGQVLVQDATSFIANGALSHQRFRDSLCFDGRGALPYYAEKIRTLGATWENGVLPSVTITPNGASPDNVQMDTTQGTVYQLARYTFPAFTTPHDYYVPNDSVSAYAKITDLSSLLTDANGNTLASRRFSLVVWGATDNDTGDDKLFVNLPIGSYNSNTSAVADTSNLAVTTIPNEFAKNGFLIARLAFRHLPAAGGTWENIVDTVLGVPFIDLRGVRPGFNASSAGITTSSQFADDAFELFDNIDVTKTAMFELSGITTGTPRTYTLPDDSSILLTQANVLGTTNQITVTPSGDDITIAIDGAFTAMAAGSDTEIQFNDSGILGADSDFTWDSTNNVLDLGDIQIDGTTRTISSTSLNDDLNLDGNGTGGVIMKGGDFNVFGNGDGIQVKLDSAAAFKVTDAADVDDVFKVDTTANGDVTINPRGTGDFNITGPVNINGSLDVDNLRFNGNQVSSTAANITLTPSGGVVFTTNNSNIQLVESGTLPTGTDLILGEVSSELGIRFRLGDGSAGIQREWDTCVEEATEDYIIRDVTGAQDYLRLDQSTVSATFSIDTNVTGTLTVTGDAQVDNLNLNGNTLTTTSGNLEINSAGANTIFEGGIFNVTSVGADVTNTNTLAFLVRNGAGTEKLRVNTSTGVVTIFQATDSTSASTGSLQVDGGIGCDKNIFSAQRFNSSPWIFVAKGSGTLGSTDASVTVNISGFERYKVYVSYTLTNLSGGIRYLRCLPNGNTTTANYNDFHNFTGGTTNRIHQQARGFNIASATGSSQLCEGTAIFTVSEPSEAGGIFELNMLSNGLTLNNTAPSRVYGGYMGIGGVSTVTSLVFEQFSTVSTNTPDTANDNLEIAIEVYGTNINTDANWT